MEHYSFLRGFADSWALVVLFLFFVGVFVWIMRPGSKEIYKDASNVIFRNESKPKDDDHGQ